MSAPYTCPLCGAAGVPDDRPVADIVGVEFRSIECAQPMQGLGGHPFPVRWLEGEILDDADREGFDLDFVRVRAPLPPGSPIAIAFGDVDPILAWVVHEPPRVLIRL